jgi:hypothetical protein
METIGPNNGLPRNIVKFPTTFVGSSSDSTNPSNRPRIDFSTEFGQMYAEKMMSKVREVTIKSTGEVINTVDVVYQMNSVWEAKAILFKLMGDHPAYNIMINCPASQPLNISAIAAKIEHDIEWSRGELPSIELSVSGTVSAGELSSLIEDNWEKILSVRAMGVFSHDGFFWGHMLFMVNKHIIFLGLPINEDQVLPDWDCEFSK